MLLLHVPRFHEASTREHGKRGFEMVIDRYTRKKKSYPSISVRFSPPLEYALGARRRWRCRDKASGPFVPGGTACFYYIQFHQRYPCISYLVFSGAVFPTVLVPGSAACRPYCLIDLVSEVIVSLSIEDL